MLNRFSIFAITLIILLGISSFIKNLAILFCSEKTFPDNPVFSLYCVENKGAAFSILENYPMFLIVISIILLSVIIVYLFRNIHTMARYELLTFTFLIAGILGNLSERILYGEVTDYVKLNFIDFPVFNFSDILITVSTVALIAQIFLSKKGQKNAD